MRLLAAALLLLVVAAALDLPLLAYAMYALLLLLFVARLVARAWIDDLTGERELQRREVALGESLAVAVRLRNVGRWPAAWMVVEDLLTARAGLHPKLRPQVTGERVAVLKLGAGAVRTLLYQVRFPLRGCYQIGPLTVESGDVFGLHRRHRVLRTAEYVLVPPRVVPLVDYAIASPRPIGEVRISQRLFEDPTLIAGVRRYEAGDPLHRVHWRATARCGELQSKTYEPTAVAGATLVLDLHAGSYPSRLEPYRSELAVTSAASLAHALCELGQQVGLATNGRDAADRIRREAAAQEAASRGRLRSESLMHQQSDRLRPIVIPAARAPDQFVRIREQLARVELTDGLSLPEFLMEVQHDLARDATVIVLTGGLSDAGSTALLALRRQGFQVSVWLMMLESHELAAAAGPLVAAGLDVRSVANEDQLAHAAGREAWL